MTALVTPTVNLNGSSKSDLVRQLMDVLSALHKAEQAICHAMPHGRDYSLSPIDGERLDSRAREAFRERARALHVMHGEFEALALDINRQGRDAA